jgi:hypothetical protein
MSIKRITLEELSVADTLDHKHYGITKLFGNYLHAVSKMKKLVCNSYRYSTYKHA